MACGKKKRCAESETNFHFFARRYSVAMGELLGKLIDPVDHGTLDLEIRYLAGNKTQTAAVIGIPTSGADFVIGR